MDGLSALHLACRRGSVELVQTILEYKEADVNILNRDGEPPIVLALAAGSPKCVRALISRSANVSYRIKEGSGQSVAHYCALHGQPECMRVSRQRNIFFLGDFFLLSEASICTILRTVFNNHRRYYWLVLILM